MIDHSPSADTACKNLHDDFARPGFTPVKGDGLKVPALLKESERFVGLWMNHIVAGNGLRRPQWCVGGMRGCRTSGGSPCFILRRDQ